jgi:D-alanyl-D-alanine carboxypeptidase (penicillin-binding protein 5/6)
MAEDTSNQLRHMKRPRRYWLILAGLVMAIALSLIWFIPAPSETESSEAEPTHAPIVEVQPRTLDGTRLSWPANGYAAIGTVEDGVLARSSDDEQPRAIASMAKIITALAVMKKQPFDVGQDGQTYVFTMEDVQGMNHQIEENGSVLPVLLDHQLTQRQALQRILIASDNNTADKLTREIFGSQAAYVSYANAMLKRMGLSRTTVADASGLDSSTVSTPSEMIVIGIAAMKNPIIAEIVAQPQAQMPGVPGGIITNTNELLGRDGVVGIKTGTTNLAGYCLLFSARFNDEDSKAVTVVGVVMGSENTASRFNDSLALLQSAQRELGLSALAQ